MYKCLNNTRILTRDSSGSATINAQRHCFPTQVQLLCMASPTPCDYLKWNKWRRLRSQRFDSVIVGDTSHLCFNSPTFAFAAPAPDHPQLLITERLKGVVTLQSLPPRFKSNFKVGRDASMKPGRNRLGRFCTDSGHIRTQTPYIYIYTGQDAAECIMVL